MFCPKCDEVYMAQKSRQDGGVQTATSLDGSYFGESFPQIFMNTFRNLIEQPPKVYLYQPKLHGFNIVGQRGSKYNHPAAMSIYQKPLSRDTFRSSGPPSKCQTCNNKK